MKKVTQPFIILTLIGVGFLVFFLLFLRPSEKKEILKDETKIQEEKFLEALQKREESECEEIENEYYREICIYNLTFEKAIKEKNVQLCENLSSEELINLCKDNYYFQTAISEKDPSLCDLLSNATSAAICKEEAIKQQKLE